MGGFVVCALVTGAMLGALISGPNNSNLMAASTGVSDLETDLLAMPSNLARPSSRSAKIGYPSDLASPFAGNRPQFRSLTTRVQAAQDNLRTFGISSNPLEKFALTSIAVSNRGNRQPDFAMKAQAKEMVSGWDTVDSETKRKLLNVLDQVKAKDSYLAGITAPMGYFDPIGFSTTVSGGKLLFYREVELKHGRIAMLAALGILVGEQFHPLFGGDIDVPSYVAFQQTPLEKFWPAVVAAVAIPEVFSVFTFQNPGDLGFDPLGLKPTDPKELKELQTKELNNGRLAMIATAGMIA